MTSAEVKIEKEDAPLAADEGLEGAAAAEAGAGDEARDEARDGSKERMEEDGEEEVELSHREAMAVFKHGLAEVIEVGKESVSGSQRDSVCEILKVDS